MKLIPKNPQSQKNNKFQCTADLELAENYLKRYNTKILKELVKEFHVTSRVLDFGAGIGTMAGIYKTLKGIAPDCVEVDINQRKFLNKKGYICYSSIDAISKKYDGIYSSNVLEHILDDKEILKILYTKLKKNGVISIYVPAFMFLYNHFDSHAGHYRRYQKKELVEKVKAANFKIIRCDYSDSIGFFSWLYVKYFGSKQTNELASERQLKFYDKYIYPLSVLIDNIGAKKFFGKSLVIVAKK
jgi:predicted SAM-dependent methyltransferase